MESAASATTAEPPPPHTPRNAHRLSRILRKPKTSVAKRAWHPAPVAANTTAARVVGVPAAAVYRLAASLSEEERQRAAQGLDPMSAVELQLVRRAARFGVQLAPLAAPLAPPVVVDPDTLRRRQERFGPVVSGAPAAVTLSEEELAKRAARSKRFGTA